MSTTLTLQEVAARLGVHYMTAYKYVRTGRLNATKVKSIWHVDRTDLDTFLAAAAATPSDDSSTDRSKRLHDRLIVGDELGSWSIIENALASGLTAERVHLELFGPALTLVGERWVAGEIDVAHEHLATTTTARLLGRMAPLVAQRGRSRGTVVLSGAPGDQHSLPTALLADLLRLRRFGVVDLGANTPAASILQIVQRYDELAAVGICVSSEQGADAIDGCVADLRVGGLEVPLFVGGSALRTTEVYGADYVSTSGADACEFVERSVSLRS